MRRSPDPSAPLSTASRASPIAPRLAKASIRVPSAIRHSSPARASMSARRMSAWTSRTRAAPSVSASGSTRISASVASRMTDVPSATAESAGPTATSAGSPIVAARIATCDVGPPRATQMPTTVDRSSARTSDGSRSSARRMVSAGEAYRRVLCPGNHAEQPPFEVEHVVRALRKSLIRAPAQAIGERADRRAPCMASTLPAGDTGVCSLEQHRIIEQRRMRRDDRLFRTARVASLVREPRGQRGKCCGEAVLLDRNPFPLFGNGYLGVPEPPCLADRKSRGRGNAEQRAVDRGACCGGGRRDTRCLDRLVHPAEDQIGDRGDRGRGIGSLRGQSDRIIVADAERQQADRGCAGRRSCHGIRF